MGSLVFEIIKQIETLETPYQGEYSYACEQTVRMYKRGAHKSK